MKKLLIEQFKAERDRESSENDRLREQIGALTAQIDTIKVDHVRIERHGIALRMVVEEMTRARRRSLPDRLNHEGD